MKREEQKIKLHFLQMSSDFFEEDAVQDLLEEKNGNDYLVYYLRAHCAALKHGEAGILEIPAGKDSANYVRRKINAGMSELPMIAAALQACVTYGLISVDRTDGKISSIDFVLTEKYTRAWTKDALERRQKRIMEAGQAASQVPQIEDKAEESDDKKPAPIDVTPVREAWDAMAKANGLSVIARMTDKRRKHIQARIREYGVDQCINAINTIPASQFLLGHNDRGWTVDIDWLCGTSDNMAKVLEGKYNRGTQQTAQPTPQSQAVTPDTIKDTIYLRGIWDSKAQAWNREKFEEVKPTLSPEMAAAIEAKIR